MALELEERLRETGKSHSVVETAKGKVKKYRDSEIRFLESIEGLCDRLLEYNMHKQFEDSRRFDRGMSETMKVLHRLSQKGVKVELGYPEEMWDSPTAEVVKMKADCEQLLEEHESDLERWFHHDSKLGDRGQPLLYWLCEDRVLKKGKDDASCLRDGRRGDLGKSGKNEL